MSPSVCNGEDSEPVSVCSHLTTQKNPSPSSSCAVCYLMNSCGLTEKQALSASKKINFKTTLNPDTVLTFFQDYGFTKSGISNIFSKFPDFISSDIHKTLKPKLDYFISKDISRLEIVKVLSNNPEILRRSLENYIIPLFDFIKKIVGTDKNVLAFFRCSGFIVIENLMHNIDVLRDEGVPESNVVNFLISQPKALTITTLKFEEIVSEIKGMGFDPSKVTFLYAIHVIRSMTKSTWETKLNAFRKWGWSDEQIQHAFRIQPMCMTISEKKISGTMDFLVNQMGISSLLFAECPKILGFSLEKRIIPRCSVYQSLVSKGFINEGKVSLRSVLCMTEESFLDKIVIKYQEEAPVLMKIYKQALNRRVMDEAVQGSALKKNEQEEEEIAVVPLDEKVLDDSQVSVLQKKVGLDAVEEPMKAIRPKKVMKESKKKKVMKKVKKKVEELDVVCMAGKELEDGELCVLKREVGIDKVEVSKKAKWPKEAFKKKLKKKVAETQDSGAVKYVAEAPGMLQESDTRVMEDSQSEEVAVCPERDAALPKVAKVVDKSQAGKPQKKASSSALVEQEEELKRIEETKKVKKPKKVLKKPKKEVEDVQGSVAKKEVGDESKQEEVEDSHSSVLKRKLVLDTGEELKKVKRAKKLIKKSKNKVEEEQCSGAKKEEHEKSKEQDEVVAVSVVEKVLEDSQASVLECKVSLDEVDESKKAKKFKKASKKQEQKANEVQGRAAVKCDVEVPELLQASNRPVMGDSQNEEATFYPESATKCVAGLLKEAKVVLKTEAGKTNKKASSGDLVKQEEELWKEEVSKKAIKRKKDLKKITKKVDEVQGSAPELLQESNSCVIKDSQSEEVAFCPERDAESVAALPKVAKVVDKSQGGKPKKKASSINLVEQEEELKKIEETKKAKKLKKVSNKAEKKVEDVHASVAKKEEEDKSEEVVVAVPIIEKLLEDSHSTIFKRKLVLDTLEETKTVKRAEKLLKKSKKKVVEEQCSAPKKKEHDKSKEEDEAVVSMVEKVLEDSQASALQSKVSLDEVEEVKKAKKINKLLKKREKKANEVQGGAAIKYDVEVSELLQASNRPFAEDSQNEEVTFCSERATESVAGVLKVAKVVVKSQAGKPNKKASSSHIVEQEEELLKEDVSKKAKKHKKVLKKIKKKMEEVPGSAPGLPQESASRVIKDSQIEEVSFCPERDAESAAVLLKMSKVVHKSQGGKPKEKASLSQLVEQEEELKKIEDTKNAKKLKKVLSKAKKKVEEVVVAVPITEKILEDSHSSVLKRKLVLDTVEETKKVKRAKKLLKKSKKKVVEEQCSAAKKEEHDKSKEEDEVVVVSMVEKVLEDSKASVLKRKVSLDEVEESKKAKAKKVLKKREKKANEEQGGAPIKYDVEVPEMLQESDSCVMKDSQSEVVAFCPERGVESVAALSKVAKVVAKGQGGKPKKKASSSDLVEQKEELKKVEETKKAKKLKKALEKAMKKVEAVQGSVAKKEEEDKSEEVVVAVPIIKKILKDGHSSDHKRKLVLDTVEETKKVKRAKKLLKKSKKKVKEEHKSKEEDEVAAVSVVEKVLEDSQAGVHKSKVSLDEVEESKKAKKIRKALKKREKKAN